MGFLNDFGVFLFTSVKPDMVKWFDFQVHLIRQYYHNAEFEKEPKFNVTILKNRFQLGSICL